MGLKADELLLVYKLILITNLARLIDSISCTWHFAQSRVKSGYNRSYDGIIYIYRIYSIVIVVTIMNKKWNAYK